MQEEKDINNLLGSWRDKHSVEKFLVAGGRPGHKFLDRDRTIKSNWSRLHTYASDILLSEKKMTILDVGCGNGATMEIFRFYGHDVYGMDYTNGFQGRET